MLLENKNAIIYGAGGPIGAVVTATVAGEGARVFLVGRTRDRLDPVAFITARAAGRHMRKQGYGVILALNSGSAHGSPRLGSTGPADAATDTLIRTLAAEIGPYGVRVHGIWTAGLPQTRSPRPAEVAATAAFLASDRAGAITGTFVNVTSGMFPPDRRYGVASGAHALRSG